MFVLSTEKHWQHVGSLPAIAVVGILVFSGTMTPLRAQGNQRPLSDFLNAQGTTQCFTPPAQAQLGWATGNFPDGSVKTNGNTGLTPPRFALIDYTGLEAKYLLSQGIDLGTTVSGSVMERPLADGRALVTVDLQTRNALGWAFDFDPSLTVNTTPLAFGSRVLDVVAGEKPGLGDAHFRVVFTNTGPGAPLPDMICINRSQNCPQVAPCPIGFEIDTLNIQASITGPLHALSGLGIEGAPGRLDVTQISAINAASQNGFKGPLSDAFPVESIALHSTGK